MAGLAKTNTFMLDTATVMIGPMADLRTLNPATHSIGLVKNFTLTAESSYTELTQDVKASIVMSVKTGNNVRASMEVYEYTAQNLAYGLGLSGGFATPTTATTSTAAASSGVILAVTSATGFSAGDTIIIGNDSRENFVVRKIVSISSNNITVDVAFSATSNVANGATVVKANVLAVGSKTDQPFYAAKVTGVLADGKQIVIEIPKFRIVNGFSLAFSGENFGNLPFEMTPYDLVASDAFYSEFAALGNSMIRVITNA